MSVVFKFQLFHILLIDGGYEEISRIFLKLKSNVFFSEHNKDGYLDSADESVHTNEDVLDPWGESVQLGPLVDPVTDDSNVVASITGGDIVLKCLIFSWLMSLLLAFNLEYSQSRV